MENNMKHLKIFVNLILTFYIANAHPPIDKGTWNLSGKVYYTNTKDDGEVTMNYLDISPGLYHFFHKNFAFGASLSYARKWDEYSSVDYYKINPGIRLYFLTGDKIYPYLISSFEYYLADYTHGKNYLNIYDLNYGCGVDFFISENVALEPYFVYRMTKWKDEKDIIFKPKIIELGVSLAIFVF